MSLFRMLFVFSMLIHAAQAYYTDTGLLRRIEALELQGRIQQNRNDQQEKLLGLYKDKMNEYENELREHTNKIQQLENELAKFTDSKKSSAINNVQDKTNDSNQINLPTQIVAGDTVGIGSHHNRNVIRKGRAKLPRLVLANDEGPIAFHATFDNGITSGIGLNQHIIFEDVHLNFGNGFHQLHGLFIAPKSGIYLFSTSIMTQPAKHDILATIMKNGSELARAYANGDSGVPDQGSVTIVTQLNMGDEVWVSSYGRQSTSDYGDKFSSFMGVLLIET